MPPLAHPPSRTSPCERTSRCSPSALLRDLNQSNGSFQVTQIRKQNRNTENAAPSSYAKFTGSKIRFFAQETKPINIGNKQLGTHARHSGSQLENSRTRLRSMRKTTESNVLGSKGTSRIGARSMAETERVTHSRGRLCCRLAARARRTARSWSIFVFAECVSSVRSCEFSFRSTFRFEFVFVVVVAQPCPSLSLSFSFWPLILSEVRLFTHQEIFFLVKTHCFLELLLLRERCDLPIYLQWH